MNRRSVSAVALLGFAAFIAVIATFLKTVVFSDFDILYPDQSAEQQEE